MKMKQYDIKLQEQKIKKKTKKKNGFARKTKTQYRKQVLRLSGAVHWLCFFKSEPNE